MIDKQPFQDGQEEGPAKYPNTGKRQEEKSAQEALTQSSRSIERVAGGS